MLLLVFVVLYAVYTQMFSVLVLFWFVCFVGWLRFFFFSVYVVFVIVTFESLSSHRSNNIGVF